MKILVSGAAGQLGALLPEALAGHRVEAIGRDRLDIASLGSVRDAIRSTRPQLVVNAAAYNKVDDAETDHEGAFRGNALGPRNLAVATAEAGIPLLHVSTDYVFDGTAGRPYHEFDAPCPLSVYGRSKLAGERAVRELNPRHFVVRTAWLYAPGRPNFPSTMIGLGRRGPVRVVDDQVGSPTYAPHLAHAIGRLVATGAFGTWHLAGAGRTSWHGLTRRLFERMGIASEVKAVGTDEFPRPAPRPACSALVSLQDPSIELPSWEDGVDEFCRAMG
ncbi:MAG: dTDP-4-dehydrorhamnose reductase [Alphaproteobacteria bacterium]